MVFSPAAFAQFNISSPTTDWVAVPYGPTLLGDPQGDHQTGQGEADIVGSTGNVATSLSSFYFKYVSGGTPTTGTIYYRVRVGGDQSPVGFKSVLLIGLDANKDGKLDLFMGIDNSGQNNGIYMWRPGTGLNISPSTTTVQTKTPIKKYTETAANYYFNSVTSTSSTAGVALDPTADTAARQDFNSATGTDYLISFSVPFADLVAALSAQGIAFNSNSPITYVMGTSTQANAFNQDLNGVSGGTSSTLTWGALGVLTQPINSSGTVVNSAPVNTVSGSRTANGSLAVSGVSVNDPDGNLATVQVSATNGTLSVSTAGGATFATGVNNTPSFTLSGTQTQINAALATLGYTPTAGYTGPASVTILSTDSGGLTDSDSIAITVVNTANTAPVANPDTASTHSGKPAAVYVIGNDVDSNGNVLTITAANLTSGTGTVSYLNGTITFTPGTSYVGTAVISYTISDGAGGTSSSTLTVSVSANNAPVANNDALNANPNTTIFINPLVNDTDANGDPLTITAASRASGQGTVTLVGNEIQFDSPNTNGTTVISYTISDGYGLTATASITVTIGSNTAPVAAADTASTTAGAPVDVDVLANDSDANGDPLIISDAVLTAGSGTAIAVNGKLRFTPAAGFIGTATITYTVDDGRGGTATATLTVTVTGNNAPTAAADSYSVAEDGTLTVNAKGILANDTDPDGNMLSAVQVTGVSHGTLTLNADGSFTYAPAANYNGPDSFTYKANDGALDSNTVTVSLTVTSVNDAPIAFPDSYTVAEDTTLSVVASGVLNNDTDVESASLSAVLVSNASNGAVTLNANGSFTYVPAGNFAGTDSFTYKANDGTTDSNTVTVSITVTAVNDAPVAAANSYSVAEDGVLSLAAPGVLGNDSDTEGSPLTAMVVSSVTHGTLTLNADGSFSYTPAANYSGPDSFTYKANDGTLDSNTATVSINVTAVNDAPAATADSYTVAEDATLTVAASGVLSNDSDVDSGTISAVLVSGPAHGTLTLNANGSFTYSPVANYNGPDSFTYKANDGALDSNTVTVSITVTPVNDTPIALADSFTVVEDGTLAIPANGVLANDTDVESALTAVLVSNVTHGTLTLNANGSLTYSPAANYNGPDSFTYKANDGALDSNTVTVSISVTPVNDVPIASAESYSVAEDSSLSIAAPGVLDNDTDGESASVTAMLVSTVSHGALTLNADGSFNYAPAANYHGPDSFTYKANDGADDSNVVTVSITVTPVNDAPVAGADAYTVAEDATLTINAATGVLDNDTDIDTASLSAVLVSSVSHGTLSLNANGSFSYVPAANYHGPDSFTYQANDGTANSNVVVVSINVTPIADAPIASPNSYTVAEEGSLTINSPGVLGDDSDSDDDNLTAVLVSNVSHGTLTLNSDGSFTYAPAANYSGSDSFTYKANDGTEDSNVVTVSITVTGINDAPVAVANSYSIPQGGTLNISAPGVLGNDPDADGDTLTAILVSGVAHGTLALNADGSFTYMPTAGFSGADSFTYKANDGTVDSNVVTVSLTVSAGNAAPVANADSYTVTGGTTLSVAAPGTLANDSDPDGNTITAVLVSSTSNGTVSLSGNGAFSYTPTSGYTGSDSFDYRVTDGSLTSSVATVTITVTPPAVNRPPVLIAPTPLATTVLTAVNFTIKATDPDNDPVTVSFGNPVHGTITGTGPEYTYTPAAGFAGTDTFTVTAKDGRGGVVTRTIKVNVTAPQALVGNYALHLRGEDGEVAAHVVLTTTKLGRATGVLTISGVRYTIRGFFGGPPTTVLPKSKGFNPAQLALATDNSDPTAPAIVVTATNERGTYTGRSVRSPYSSQNPPPQVGSYTLIASRQPLILDRVGAELSEQTQSVPMVASVLTIRVLRSGSVIFNGSSGHGYPLTCSTYVMQGGEVPFYAGRNNPGSSIQHSTFTFRDDTTATEENTAPAISGTLRWIAGQDTRIPVPFDADYAVLGARFTPVRDGANLLNSSALTLSLDIPSYTTAGLATPYEETRAFSGNLLPNLTGNISSVRVNFNTGTFITRVQGRVTRPIIGVIIQGEGIDRGLGSVVDFTSLGTCELRPAQAETAGAQ